MPNIVFENEEITIKAGNGANVWIERKDGPGMAHIHLSGGAHNTATWWLKKNAARPEQRTLRFKECKKTPEQEDWADLITW